ncbi:hypothetical protein GW17_00045125 [Ensete ventricosum]|nr:hypothetical protein GW17_00045125 [Ensete ventricosum]
MRARLWNNCLPTKAMHMGKVPTGKPLVGRGGTGWWPSTHRALLEATPALGSSRIWARNPQARCPCEATYAHVVPSTAIKAALPPAIACTRQWATFARAVHAAKGDDRLHEGKLVFLRKE